MNKRLPKIDDKKQRILKLQKESNEKRNKIIKSRNGELKLRLSRIMKTLNEQNNKIDQLHNRHENFKQSILKYHRDYNEKTKDEERAFLKAVEMSDLNGPSFEDILSTQLNTIHTERHNNNTPQLLNDSRNIAYKKQIINRNISTVTLSPTYSTLINRSVDHMKVCDASTFSIKSGTNSPNGSNFSHLMPSNQRCYQHHSLSEKILYNKTCSYCTSKDSKLITYKCKVCNIYIHDVCRAGEKYKICIPLKVTSAKITNSRSLKLSDLCTCNPMVPDVLLALMHHIHMFGLTTDNIYTMTGKEKETRDLCNKLLEGKIKYLIKFDIRIVANAFIMILSNINVPLLSLRTINALTASVNINENAFRESLVSSLMETDVQDTLIYVLLHLKVISMNSRCGFNAERLAESLSSCIVDNRCHSLKTNEVLQKLIEIDTDFYLQRFNVDKVFFGRFFKL